MRIQLTGKKQFPQNSMLLCYLGRQETKICHKKKHRRGCNFCHKAVFLCVYAERTWNREQSWVPLQQRAGWAGPAGSTLSSLLPAPGRAPQLLLQLAGTAAHKIPNKIPAELDFNPGSARANGRAAPLSQQSGEELCSAEELTHYKMTAGIQFNGSTVPGMNGWGEAHTSQFLLLKT